MLDCRDLPQLSYERSQKRLERATGVLGAKVVTRLLAFSLYLLGANRDALAGCLGIRLETLKSLVKRGFSDVRAATAVSELVFSVAVKGAIATGSSELTTSSVAIQAAKSGTGTPAIGGVTSLISTNSHSA